MTFPNGLCASDYELLIRAYWSPTAFKDWVDVGNEIGAARRRLTENGLVVPADEPGSKHQSRLTPRGEAFVRTILALPLPVAIWQVPGLPPRGRWSAQEGGIAWVDLP